MAFTRRQLAEIKALLRSNAAIRREAEFDARDEALGEVSTRVETVTSAAARGRKGGKARAGKLSAAERSAAASRAAKARWGK